VGEKEQGAGDGGSVCVPDLSQGAGRSETGHTGTVRSASGPRWRDWLRPAVLYLRAGRHHPYPPVSPQPTRAACWFPCQSVPPLLPSPHFPPHPLPVNCLLVST
jgi:hypothetical protein